MISVREVVSDPDVTAPQPFTILRSTDTWVLGGVVSMTTSITMIGPVQQASNKEIQMLAEADRVGSIFAFWSTQPIYVTRGYAPVPSVHGEIPAGAPPTSTLALSVEPPQDALNLWKNGLLLQDGPDYVLVGTTINLTVQAQPGDKFYATWQATASVQPANSDILVYGGEQYRVLQTYHDPGCGYWKALGTRLRMA